jgi:hypothetical protein
MHLIINAAVLQWPRWTSPARERPRAAEGAVMPAFRDLSGGEDALFSLRPDDQFGCTEAGAWYALRWHATRPGGVILLQDDAGRRQVAPAVTDDALAAAWHSLSGDIYTRPRLEPVPAAVAAGTS